MTSSRDAVPAVPNVFPDSNRIGRRGARFWRLCGSNRHPNQRHRHPTRGGRGAGDCSRDRGRDGIVGGKPRRDGVPERGRRRLQRGARTPMALLTKAPAPKRAKPDPESAVPGDDHAGSTRAGGVESAPRDPPARRGTLGDQTRPEVRACPRRCLISIPKRACAPLPTPLHDPDTDTYLPPTPRHRTEADIVVAKKKLDALREWLRACDRPGAPRVVLVVGPSGCGKTAAVRLVAAEAGRDVHEWRPRSPPSGTSSSTPTPRASRTAPRWTISQRSFSARRDTHPSASPRRG